MSFNVILERSQKKNIYEASQEAAISCLPRIGAQKLSLAILFTSFHYNTQPILKRIASILKNPVPVIGCSAEGIFSSEGYQKEGAVLMLIGSPRVKISCAAVNTDSALNDYAAGQELAARLLLPIKGMHRQTGILFSCGKSAYKSNHLKGLQNILGRSFPFIGGSIDADNNPLNTFLYYNQEIVKNGIVSAIFAGKLNCGIGTRHGWKPLGKVRTVTESSDNIIKTIDYKPASQLYEDYFAKNRGELQKELYHINTLYPIGIRAEGKTEYLLRNVLTFNEDGSVTTQGDVPQASQVRLMICTKESCLKASQDACQKAALGLKGKAMELAVVISSISRYHLLGRNAPAEIKIIKETLGNDVPFIGLYSRGEYSPMDSMNYYGQTYLHNQTISVLGMAE